MQEMKRSVHLFQLLFWPHHQPLRYFSAHQWYLLSGEHGLMNLTKSCWLTFSLWRHDFISVVWKWAPTRQVISMSQLECCSANVFPNISLSVRGYYFQVYLRTITFLFFSAFFMFQQKSEDFAPLIHSICNCKYQTKDCFLEQRGRKALRGVLSY